MKLSIVWSVCLNFGVIETIDWIALHKTPLGVGHGFDGNHVGGTQALPLKLTEEENQSEEGLSNFDICDNLSSDSFNIQRRICHRFPKIMDAIVTATKQTKLACEVSSD